MTRETIEAKLAYYTVMQLAYRSAGDADGERTFREMIEDLHRIAKDQDIAIRCTLVVKRMRAMTGLPS